MLQLIRELGVADAVGVGAGTLIEVGVSVGALDGVGVSVGVLDGVGVDCAVAVGGNGVGEGVAEDFIPNGR